MKLFTDFQTHPDYLWKLSLFAFVFGCCVGSYLNVVIFRLPRGMKTSEPRRSFCPSCKYAIPFWHNIPVLSWIILRGRCANCREPISPRYPLVELLTGALFLLTFWHTGWDWRLFPAWIFVALCIAGSYIDLDHQILPHQITWGGAIAGFIAAAAVPNMIVEGTRWWNLLHSLGGAALGYGLIYGIVQLGKMAFGRLRLKFEQPVEWSVRQPEGAEEPTFMVSGEEELWTNIFSRKNDRLIIRAGRAELDDRSFDDVIVTISEDTVQVTPQAGGATETLPLENIKAMRGMCVSVEQPREAMGMGDANWMACVGAFLGWKAVLFAIFAGSIIGAVTSLTMIALRRREWAARIPFGPYLAAGALLWLFFGPWLLEWYLGLRFSAEAVAVVTGG